MPRSRSTLVRSPRSLLAAAGLAVALLAATPAFADSPVGSFFTYQGELRQNGTLYTGNVADFEFDLYADSSGGLPLTPVPYGLPNTPVFNGRFTASIDFGSGVFGPNVRWLEIRVRTPGSPSFTALQPRQRLTPAPVAQYALNAPASLTPFRLNGAGDAIFNNAKSVGINADTPDATLTVKGTTGSNLGFNFNDYFYGRPAEKFVGVNRSSRIAADENFGISNALGQNAGVGMFISTTSAGGTPYYGLRNPTNSIISSLEAVTSDWVLALGPTASVTPRLRVRPTGATSITATDVNTLNLTSTAAQGTQLLITSAGATSPANRTQWSFFADADGGPSGAGKFSIRPGPAASPLMTLQPDGKVGVGRTAPEARFTVLGSDQWAPSVGTGFGDFTITDGTRGLSLGVALTGAGAGAGRIWTRGSSSLALGSGSGPSVDLLFINSNGRVGIGTGNAPLERFHVAGGNALFDANASVKGDFFVDGGTQLDGNVSLTSGGTLNVSGASTFTGATTHTGGFTAAANSSVNANLSISQALNVDASGNNNGLISANALRFGVASGEGILSKRTAGGNQFGLDLFTASTPRLSITATGNVGLGTSSPTTRLDVSGNISLTDTGALGLAFKGNGESGADTGIGHPSDGVLTFRGNAQEFGRMDGLGNWGFGTAAPLDRVHIANGSLRIEGPGNGVRFPDGTLQTSAAGNSLWTAGAGAIAWRNGNVGINTASPADALTVGGGITLDANNANDGTTNTPFLRFAPGSGEGILSNRAGTENLFGLDFATGFIKRLSITNTGNVVVGNDTAPTHQFTVRTGAVGDVARFTSLSSAGTALQLENRQGTLGNPGGAWNLVVTQGGASAGTGFTNGGLFELRSAVGATTSLRIARSGVMQINPAGIGTSTPVGTFLDVGGNIRCVSLTQTSTAVLKDHVQTITGALETLHALRGVTYVWNDRAPQDVVGHADVGFIAEEVDRVLPQIVAKDDAGRPVGLDYGKVSAVTVEAVKEQQLQIDALRAENADLKARLDRLERALLAQPDAHTRAAR